MGCEWSCILSSTLKGDNKKQYFGWESTCALKNVINGFLSSCFEGLQRPACHLYEETMVALLCSLKVRSSDVIPPTFF